MTLNQQQIDALRHIVDHCRKAGELVARIGTWEKLESDWEAQYALARCVEIIGQASTRLGPDFHRTHPAVPWRLIVGMRNRLIHNYDGVNAQRLWDTAAMDVPTLTAAVEVILHTEGR